MNSHYILVFQSKIVAECNVPLASGYPASEARELFADIRHEFPGAAIYVRLGNESRVNIEPNVVHLVKGATL